MSVNSAIIYSICSPLPISSDEGEEERHVLEQEVVTVSRIFDKNQSRLQCVGWSTGVLHDLITCFVFRQRPSRTLPARVKQLALHVLC